jgi:probable rRNA maturation factor
MPITQKINFFFQKPVSLNSRQRLKKFLLSIFKKEGRQLKTLNYIFCSDQTLLKINIDFLDHNFYTDIISFDLTDPGEDLVGEVYISVDRVRANAKSLNIPLNKELLRVVIHGVLHFCGYQDKSTKDKTLMRQKEEEYLERFQFFT